MIVLGAAIFGILLGVMTARSRKGNKKDMAQYGAGFGLFFVILGVILTIIVDRLAA